MIKNVLIAFLSLPMAIFVASAEEKILQPVLSTRSLQFLETEGFRFKDLNQNGQLDRYEDWRLPTEERSKDLLARMSVEQKVGFILISTTRLKNERSFESDPAAAKPVSSDFNEEDLVQSNNIFTRKPLPVPVMTAAGTTKAVTRFHLRHFILRANAGTRILAEWANRLQELCEQQPLGIPAIVASNPRNHITANATLGTSVGRTVFSVWPGELGLSAMRDLKRTREFAAIARQEWLAVGLRKGYMYMADLATEPRWQRIEGTFGEDAEWAAKMIREVVLGFQGDRLGCGSVALTTKHFPGGGAGEKGQDPHFEWGKREIFPGGMFENHLVPFQAAIEAGTSAIMPYYSLPAGTGYEEIAYAYNRRILQDLLRGKLGFQGIINSDTGPIEMMPWGVENLSIPQRYQKALEAGINLFSGTADPTLLLETVKSGMVDIGLIDDSVIRLLNEKFALGLFENPFVDEAAAEAIVGNARFQAKADVALRKSIVLLRNGNKTLPLGAKTKVYFEIHQKRFGASVSGPGNVFTAKDKPAPFQLVQTPEEAEMILFWIKPAIRPLFASDGSPLSISLSKCAVDVDYIRQWTAKKPTILAIDFSNPWVIDEIYPQAAKAKIEGVLATFGTTPEALMDVISGKFPPTGKMPFSTPASEEAVIRQKEDVPGYLEGRAYALFRYDEGLTYP